MSNPVGASTTSWIGHHLQNLAAHFCERLAEYGWKPHRDLLAQKTYRGPQFTCICVKRRGVQFDRIRDFKYYSFNTIPPTSHSGLAPGCFAPSSTWRATILDTSGVIRDFKKYGVNLSTNHYDIVRAISALRTCVFLFLRIGAP